MSCAVPARATLTEPEERSGLNTGREAARWGQQHARSRSERAHALPTRLLGRTVKALGGKPMRSACLDIVPKNDVLCTATANLTPTEVRERSWKYAKYVTEYNKANDKSYDKLR